MRAGMRRLTTVLATIRANLPAPGIRPKSNVRTNITLSPGNDNTQTKERKTAGRISEDIILHKISLR